MIKEIRAKFYKEAIKTDELISAEYDAKYNDKYSVIDGKGLAPFELEKSGNKLKAKPVDDWEEGRDIVKGVWGWSNETPNKPIDPLSRDTTLRAKIKQQKKYFLSKTKSESLRKLKVEFYNEALK